MNFVVIANCNPLSIAMLGRQKRTALFFFWISLRLSWSCGFVPPHSCEERPRKTNISVTEEGEAQYIPRASPRTYLHAQQLIS